MIDRNLREDGEKAAREVKLLLLGKGGRAGLADGGSQPAWGQGVWRVCWARAPRHWEARRGRAKAAEGSSCSARGCFRSVSLCGAAQSRGGCPSPRSPSSLFPWLGETRPRGAGASLACLGVDPARSRGADREEPLFSEVSSAL